MEMYPYQAKFNINIHHDYTAKILQATVMSVFTGLGWPGLV